MTPVLSLPFLGPIDPSLLCFPMVCCCLSPHTYERPLSNGSFTLPHKVLISFFKKEKEREIYSHLTACPRAKIISAFPSLFPSSLSLTYSAFHPRSGGAALLQVSGPVCSHEIAVFLGSTYLQLLDPKLPPVPWSPLPSLL